MAPHEWSAPGYVEAWTARDDKEAMLSVPWRISAELVRDDGIDVTSIIDLGSGPGGFLDLMLVAFPDAHGTWVDDSEPMLERARERLAPLSGRVDFVLGDATRLESLDLGQADVITSSRMIHHFIPDAIGALYRAVSAALVPGGWFCNVDHFGAPDDFELRYRRIKPRLTGHEKSGAPGHTHEAPFSLISRHLDWLADAGFDMADSPWRHLYTALVVAKRG